MALAKLGRHAEAIAVYDQVVERTVRARDARLRSLALIDKGLALRNLGRDREAVAVLQRVLRQLPSSPANLAARSIG